MLTEKGILIVGVEKNGEVHREFEIREATIGDTIAVYDVEENVARAEKNSAFLGLCILAGQIVSLGTIPKEEITPALIMELSPGDFNTLSAASARLEERRKSFLETAP